MLRAILLLQLRSAAGIGRDGAGPEPRSRRCRPAAIPAAWPSRSWPRASTTRSPQIARRLARDGEGELIGFDLVDKDNRPFGDSRADTPAHWGGDGTIVAGNILDATIGTRLVPVRVDPRNPASLARAVAFIAQTPARIVVVPMWGPRKEDWQPFRQAVEHFSAASLRRRRPATTAKTSTRTPSIRRPSPCPMSSWSPPRAARSRLAQRTISRAANWGAKTVDAVALAGRFSRLPRPLPRKLPRAALSASPGLNGAELKLRLIQHPLIQREGETPQRTRSLAILAPMVLRQVQPAPDPAARFSTRRASPSACKSRFRATRDPKTAR